MFAKLLKHEFRANAGTMTILGSIMLAVGALAGLAVRFIIWYFGNNPNGVAAPMLLITSSIFIGGTFIFTAVFLSAGDLLPLYRFYQNKFTDEGYLTFTLPVNSHQIILSSFVPVIVWRLAVFAVALVSGVLAFFLATVGTEVMQIDILRQLWDTIGHELKFLLNALQLDTGFVVVLILNMLISSLSSVMMAMMSITIGSVATKKHKLLAGVAIYIVSNYAVSILTQAFSASNIMLYDSYTSATEFSTTVMLPQLIIRLILMVGAYFVTWYLTSKKLNLS